MDGKATERTADEINKLEGSFKYCWPHSPFDYTQLTLRKSPNDVISMSGCGICKKEFAVVNYTWLKDVFHKLGATEAGERIPKDTLCPHCGARFFGRTDT